MSNGYEKNMICLTYLLFEERKPWIEEEVKFLNPSIEPLGWKEVTHLVENDQNGKTQYKLSKHNQDTHLLML